MMEAAKQETEKQVALFKTEGSSSRDAMLKAIQKNQPACQALPQIPAFAPFFDDVVQKFTEVLTAIGGSVYFVSGYDEIISQVQSLFAGAERVVSFEPYFSVYNETIDELHSPHAFEDVDVCILSAPLAVAENGAVWISDEQMPVRVLPFISQNLVAVVRIEDIVATMHDAYHLIAEKEYGFATFIAGPSKTADIEQSLVLGAHGPKAMTVFLLQNG